MKVHQHGLGVGKFYPLHVGHQHLIRYAQQRCDELTVCVLGSRVESVPLDVRQGWIEAEHPGVRVVTGWDEAPMTVDDPELWAAHVAAITETVARPVDVVFSSENYGEELARRLGAVHVMVDPDRLVVPVSGTAVRADLASHWHLLPPSVRAWFVFRVVVLGAESTGTTALTQDLAAAYATTHAEEFGRFYCYDRPGGLDAPWASHEFSLIADTQLTWNATAAAKAPVPVVFFDTDALATAGWHERYVGEASAAVEELAARNAPDLYVLTACDIPFEQDGWRDGEHIRKSMTQRFREVLAAQATPWVEVSGSREERVAEVRILVDAMMKKGKSLADPIGWEKRSAIAGRRT